MPSALLSVRVENEEKSFIARAAKTSGVKVSEYVRQAVTTRAQMDLMERPALQLDEQDWQAFEDFMARPAREIPKLRALLSQPAPWEK